MFSFDIRQFIDEEEEETASKAKSPIADELKTRLADIADRLNASLDSLVADCGSIRSRFQEIQDQLPEDLIDSVSPAVFLEQYKFKLERAKQRMSDRLEHKALETTIQVSRQQVNEEKTKLDALTAGPESTRQELDQLKQQESELLVQLRQCRVKISEAEKRIADLPQAIEEQKSKLKSSIKHLATLNKSLKPVPGTDAADAKAIDEVEQIRLRAILAIQNFLG
uniref:Aminotransferase-like protein n=1 Tax=Oryza punctata TaxID=4537 RepID=A0A1V1H6K2_ORYPU|nr:aminotransferase-like protein [Oryza punctata]